MISYKPFFDTIKKKGITTYQLTQNYKLSRSLLDRLKHNKPINTTTLNTLCKTLHCKVEDILLYLEETL